MIINFKHNKACPHGQTGNLWSECSCRHKLLGRPFTHWQRQAQELVIGNLLQAAQLDTSSVIGSLARRYLMDLAHSADTELVNMLLDMREQASMNQAAMTALGDPG